MPDTPFLTAAGEHRRGEILRLAQAEAARLRRRRQTLRATAAGVAVVVLTVTLTHWPALPKTGHPIVITPVPTTRQVAVAASHPALAPHPRQIVIQFIKTEPDLARQMAVPPQKPSWRRLTDDQLIQELADAGHPAGLGWVDGREFVLYRPEAGSEGHLRGGKIAPRR